MRYFYKQSRMVRRRQRLRLAAQAGLVAAAVLAWSQAAAGTLDLTVRNGMVTLDAQAAPLGEVMRALSEKADFRLVMKQDLRAPVTWRLDEVPIEQAVTRLLARVSSVALYAPEGDGNGSVLSEVRILRGGNNDAPLVEHRTALAAAQNTPGLSEGPATPGNQASTPKEAARNQLASIGNLRPAAGEVGPIDYALDDGDAADRRRAAQLAAKRRPDLAHNALTGALSDPDPVVRLRAVQGLTRLGGEQAVTILSQVLLEDSEPRIRRIAAVGLGRINTESAFWALMEANSDPEQSVRESVNAALVALERRGVNASREAGTGTTVQ